MSFDEDTMVFLGTYLGAEFLWCKSYAYSALITTTNSFFKLIVRICISTGSVEFQLLYIFADTFINLNLII